MDLLIANYSVNSGGADVAPVSGTPQYATSGNPPSQRATEFPAYQLNALMKEIIGVITGAGLTPDRTNNGQLLAAILALIGPSPATWCGTSIGSANAQVLTPPATMTTFPTGAAVVFEAGYTNTGALNITVGSFGTFAVRKDSPTGPIPLTGGEVFVGNILNARFDGTYLQLVDTDLGTAALANASSNTGTVVAAYGAFTPGHILTAKDASGTAQDGGPAPSNEDTYLTTTANITTGGYLLNSQAGPFTITSSATPNAGDNLRITDGGRACAQNPVTWNPNGATVNGNAGNFIFDLDGGSASFWFKSGNWSRE